MNKYPENDYSVFDRPEVTSFLFHPRPETGSFTSPENVKEISIPIDEDIIIGARIYHADRESPTILFFHGNGEIVADYDDIGLLFARMGINFFPVDYRGYGRSTGYPSVSTMMHDCHVIFEFMQDWLKNNNYTNHIIVMGRSLGSASALELAKHYPEQIKGLIIESGFAYASPLLRLLGINTEAIGLTEKSGFQNTDKIKKFSGPTLVIHSEYDHIIPFSDGQALYEASSAPGKRFLKIPDANHNTIFAYGMEEYLKAVTRLTEEVKA